MSEAGHDRVGRFPDRIADDVVVDRAFGPHEKIVVGTEPVVIQAPRDARNLLRILSRNIRGVRETRTANTASTMGDLVRSVRGPLSAVDALVYAGFATIPRYRLRRSRAGTTWERDASTR